MVVDYLVVDEMVIISKLFDYNCMFSIGCIPIFLKYLNLANNILKSI
jgi:hypothetical protein